ncbi:MAG: preprotein translocase subunit SecY [Lachnospiraceae bacterium]|nr:preprotein translocase subunit SecY [Lachnospiraceae bacterium]
MFKTFRNAWKIEDLRKKFIFTFMALVIVRFGCQLFVPGIDSTNIQAFFNEFSGADFFDAFTGGSFSQLSVFALSITPYITSSIIIQLLTIAIPKLEEIQKDGEDGRKKIAEITRYLTVVLAVMESFAMAVGFSKSGYITGGKPVIAMMILSMTAGSAFLMWLGEQITERGVGNGISIILLINIVSRIPNDITNLFTQFVANAGNRVNAVIGAVVIIAVIVFIVAFVIILSDAERRIPVQYAKKVQGRRQVGGQNTYIPLKVNTAGVMPIIFTVSLLQLPILLAQLKGIRPASGLDAEGKSVGLLPKILKVLSTNQWFKMSSFGEFKYTVGLILYIAMLIFFAYFYTSITFNPMEVANNMKKQGGFIPGIRPGKPTQEYLTGVLNSVILIGAIGLTIVAIVPIFFEGAFGANVSFGGTSMIIVVGVVLETMKQVESQMLVRHYKGFLND